jgi:sugar fermentation stimulation protein A
MELFRNILNGAFLSRPNRFVVECLVRDRKARAYLPNPGRLWELFFPGVKLFLTMPPPAPGRKLAYLVVAVEHDGVPIMLHTHHNNLVARQLIEQGLVPGLEGAEVVQQEYRVGHSRFDFLLRKDGREVLVEVKSCTLFHDTLAMFPDAVSARATKHLLELEELSRKGYQAVVLFIVHSPTAKWFMPEHHTDLAFCRALLAVRGRVLVKALGVEWEQDLSLGNRVRELDIPWDLVERESHDRGSYLIVLKLPRDRRIEVGSLGKILFRKGWYIYAGSAMKDLTQRIARHQRLTKKKHWHIDHLREHALFVAGIPIRSSVDRECEIAAAFAKIAEWQVPGFGSSDCSCASHLFCMQHDPFLDREFIATLLHFRMGLLEDELKLHRPS